MAFRCSTLEAFKAPLHDFTYEALDFSFWVTVEEVLKSKERLVAVWAEDGVSNYMLIAWKEVFLEKPNRRERKAPFVA